MNTVDQIVKNAEGQAKIHCLSTIVSAILPTEKSDTEAVKRAVKIYNMITATIK